MTTPMTAAAAKLRNGTANKSLTSCKRTGTCAYRGRAAEVSNAGTAAKARARGEVAATECSASAKAPHASTATAAECATATSAGVSAGIDLALHLVHRFAGLGLAETTARQMDYPWSPDQGEELPPVAGEALI